MLPRLPGRPAPPVPIRLQSLKLFLHKGCKWWGRRANVPNCGRIDAPIPGQSTHTVFSSARAIRRYAPPCHSWALRPPIRAKKPRGVPIALEPPRGRGNEAVEVWAKEQDGRRLQRETSFAHMTRIENSQKETTRTTKRFGNPPCRPGWPWNTTTFRASGDRILRSAVQHPTLRCSCAGAEDPREQTGDGPRPIAFSDSEAVLRRIRSGERGPGQRYVIGRLCRNNRIGPRHHRAV